jgi:hypothetical protein
MPRLRGSASRRRSERRGPSWRRSAMPKGPRVPRMRSGGCWPREVRETTPCLVDCSPVFSREVSPFRWWSCVLAAASLDLPLMHVALSGPGMAAGSRSSTGGSSIVSAAAAASAAAAGLAPAPAAATGGGSREGSRQGSTAGATPSAAATTPVGPAAAKAAPKLVVPMLKVGYRALSVPFWLFVVLPLSSSLPPLRLNSLPLISPASAK